MVEQIVQSPSKPITPGDVDIAKHTLIRRRDTHFDSKTRSGRRVTVIRA